MTNPSTRRDVLQSLGALGLMALSRYMTYVLPDKTHVYGPGDYFFESGDVTHTAQNKTDAPMVHVLFEILPVELKGPSIMLPKRA